MLRLAKVETLLLDRSKLDRAIRSGKISVIPDLWQRYRPWTIIYNEVSDNPARCSLELGRANLNSYLRDRKSLDDAVRSGCLVGIERAWDKFYRWTECLAPLEGPSSVDGFL